MTLHSVILLSVFVYVSFGNEITSDSTEEVVVEGSSVQFSCSYSSAYDLQWYRQYPRGAPEFLVLITDGVKENRTSEIDPRFTTKLRREKQTQHVYLEISSVSLSDSDLYYCAMRPTVTQNTTTLNKNTSPACKDYNSCI
ncbi:T cell antigen receptor alpha chain VJC region [Triplophysa rosa]|nr:T cell antigen receptor alpha chain VJC region [Triplophysa rosa]